MNANVYKQDGKYYCGYYVTSWKNRFKKPKYQNIRVKITGCIGTTRLTVITNKRINHNKPFKLVGTAQ